MRKVWYLFFVVLVAAGCREHYEPAIVYPSTGYLVVEGFINSGQGATTIRLSRTIKISDSAAIVNERGAQVMVQGEDNSKMNLTEVMPGTYVVDHLTLANDKKYRLRIVTSQGKEYLSDFAIPIKTPPIDSISWIRQPGGIQLYIETHDPLNKTKYYSWNYEEAWEFRSAYSRSLIFVKDQTGAVTGVRYINPDHSIDSTVYRCWQFNNSASILTGSTAKLSQAIIHLPLIFIEEGSWKISVLYTIKLYQHSISPSGFEFLKRMKKNTEQVGSIFDSQPSDLNSNIHCTTQPLEPVIGYMDITDAQEKRLWITPSEVTPWRFVLNCNTEVWSYSQNLDSLYKSKLYIPTTPYDFVSFSVANAICVDCTLRGFNKRPSYWPN